MSQKDLPRISVITPCLNEARHICAMLDSYVAQEYSNKELVIQDGGSTDGTLEILRSYPVRWVSEHDAGPHDALNRALVSATGDIIVVMPANDVFTPGALSIAARVLALNPAVMMAYGDSQFIDKNGAPYLHWPARRFDLDALFWNHYIQLQSAYVRRDVFDTVGTFAASILGPGDTEWLFRFVEHYSPDTLLYIPETLSGHRRCERFDSVSYRNCAQGALALIEMGERFLGKGDNVGRLRGGGGRARAGILCRAALFWSCGGQTRTAWRTYLRGVYAHPRALLSVYGMKIWLHLLLGRGGSTWCRAWLTMLHRWLHAFRRDRGQACSGDT